MDPRTHLDDLWAQTLFRNQIRFSVENYYALCTFEGASGGKCISNGRIHARISFGTIPLYFEHPAWRSQSILVQPCSYGSRRWRLVDPVATSRCEVWDTSRRSPNQRRLLRDRVIPGKVCNKMQRIRPVARLLESQDISVIAE